MFIFGLSSAALAGLAWLIPNHTLPWTAFHSDMVMALSLFVLLCGLLVSRKYELRRWPAIAVFAALVCVIPLIQVEVGQIRFAGDGVMASLYVLGFALAIVSGAGVSRSGRAPEAADVLFRMLLGVSLASVWVQLDQWLSLGQFGLYGAFSMARPSGNLAQPNQMATLLVLGFIGGLVLYHQHRVGRVGLLVMTLFLGFGMVLTQSRVVWLELGLVLAGLAAMRRRTELRLSPTMCLALGGVFVALFASWIPLIDLLYLADGRLAVGEGRMEAGTRPTHWASMVDAIGRQPWFGYGWNQVAVAQSRVAADHRATGELIEHSHSMFLDLMVWNGIPAGLFVVAALCGWFWLHFRACRSATVAFLLMAIGVVFVHALVEFPLEYAYFLLPVGFMMGLVEVKSGAGPFVVVLRGVTASVVIGASALTIAVVAEYFQAEANLLILRLESARIGTSRIVSTAPDLKLLTQLREFLHFARTEARHGMSESELDWMRDVAERFGYPPVLFRYALAAGLNGRPEDARRMLVNLCKMHSKRILPEARYNWNLLVLAHPELTVVQFPPLP